DERSQQDMASRSAVRPLGRQPRCRKNSRALGARYDEPRSVLRVCYGVSRKGEGDRSGRDVPDTVAQVCEIPIVLAEERSGGVGWRREHSTSRLDRIAPIGVYAVRGAAADTHRAHIQADGTDW